MRSAGSRSGSFACTPALPGNHGPTHPSRTWHFCHADSTPFVQMGTTCYAWQHQPVELEERTLATLRGSPCTVSSTALSRSWAATSTTFA